MKSWEGRQINHLNYLARRGRAGFSCSRGTRVNAGRLRNWVPALTRFATSGWQCFRLNLFFFLQYDATPRANSTYKTQPTDQTNKQTKQTTKPLLPFQKDFLKSYIVFQQITSITEVRHSIFCLNVVDDAGHNHTGIYTCTLVCVHNACSALTNQERRADNLHRCWVVIQLQLPR